MPGLQQGMYPMAMPSTGSQQQAPQPALQGLDPWQAYMQGGRGS
jgi:hypothetical protein